MSRTKRHVQYWARYVSPQTLTWAGLGNDSWLEHDYKDALSNGRDCKSRSYINPNPQGVENCSRGWGEVYVGKLRRLYKRRKSCRTRQIAKIDISKQLNDML